VREGGREGGSERVSGYCLMSTIFQRDDDEVCFVLDQHP